MKYLQSFAVVVCAPITGAGKIPSDTPTQFV